MDINSIRNIFRSRSRSRRAPIIAAALIVGAALDASAKSWFYISDSSANNYGLNNPSAWADANNTLATEFNTSDKYYVKSGKNLRFKDGTWNGGEFFFGEPSAVADSTKVAYGTHQGGYITFNNVVHFDNGNLRVYQIGDLNQRLDLVLNANSIVVGSPASNPFYFRCGLLSNGVVEHRYSNRRLIVNAPISSTSDSVGLRIGGNNSQGTNFIVAVTGDCSRYMGTIFVKTYNDAITAAGNWDTRLMLGDTTVGGAIQLDAKTAIEARTAVKDDWAAGAPSECTVGSLSLAANSVILVSGDKTTPTNGIIHVSDSLSVIAPVTVKLNYAAAPAQEGNLVTILTAPAGSNLDAADFDLDLGTTSTAMEYDFRVDVDETTGRKSLVVEFPPVIEQVAHYTGEGTKDVAESSGSSITNALAWSNNDVPGPNYSNCHYYSGSSFNLRTLYDPNADYDFPCLSFTKEGISTYFVIDTKSFRVPEFRTGQTGCTIWLGKGSSSTGVTKTLKADRFVNNANPDRGLSVNLGAWYYQTMVIDAEVVGNGDFILQGIKGTSSTKGNYVFTGLNTNFTGRITVAHALANTDGRHNFNNLYQTLYVNDGRNLGGARETFSARALMLQDMSRLSVTNGTVTLESGLNRGIYIKDCGRLFADAGCTLDVKWPVRMWGKLWKEGAGTLVLGGEATFEGGTPKANSNLFEVAQGTLAIASHNAIDGMATTFDNGTSLKLKIDPANADLTKYGILNAKTATPFTLGAGHGGKLPLSLDTTAYPVPTRRSLTVGLVTVTNTVATVEAVRAMMPTGTLYEGIGNLIVERENVGEGTVTFALELKDRCTTIVFK